MYIRFFFFLPLFFLFGCFAPKCHNFPIYGADQFVCDSYELRKGKSAILEMMGIEMEEISPYDMKEYVDTIMEGDLLSIVVYHPLRGEDFSKPFQLINQTLGGFLVSEGTIQLPDIPSLEVVGYTLDEAREKIKEAYSKEIQNVDVYLLFKDRSTRKVELAGLVQSSSIPVDGKVRLFEVLSKAKVQPGANLFMSYVLRKGKPLSLDLHKLLNEGDMSQNIVMRGGDKIYIASSTDAKVFLAGEILLPQAVPLIYGTMPIQEALVAAGGIPFTGDRRNIQVIRGSAKCPRVYCLAWEHIIHLPNESLLVMPGDTIFISEKPITKWNRFIGQLMPSVYGMQSASQLYQLFMQN